MHIHSTSHRVSYTHAYCTCNISNAISHDAKPRSPHLIRLCLRPPLVMVVQHKPFRKAISYYVCMYMHNASGLSTRDYHIKRFRRIGNMHRDAQIRPGSTIICASIRTPNICINIVLVNRNLLHKCTLTSERVYKTIAHDVQQLWVARFRRYDQMLFGRCQLDAAKRPRSGDGHRADLRRQRHRQPSGKRHEQGNRVAIAPSGRRAHGDAEQGVVILFMFAKRPQP